MTKVNFVTSDYRRRVSGAPPLNLRNRYFEQNPVLNPDGASLLARPGMRKLMEVGKGPIRGLHSSAGAFDGDLFVVSGDTLYRINNRKEAELIFTGLFNPVRGVVNMASTGSIGATPEYLFLADGANLYYYSPLTGTLFGIPMPDDIGVVDVAVISSYVIVLPVQEGEFVGRFYWIEPGETTVLEDNFATAERSPDGVFGVQVFGDQFWLPGQSTTEVWFPTGELDTPMRRVQGVVLDRGSWAGTSAAIHETLMLVDSNGGVFSFRGGAPEPVASPDISEEIRRAISLQQSQIV